MSAFPPCPEVVLDGTGSPHDPCNMATNVVELPDSVVAKSGVECTADATAGLERSPAYSCPPRGPIRDH